MKIKRVTKQIEKRYVHGTNFAKGDYIPEKTTYWAELIGGAIIELSAIAIRAFFDRQRITPNLLKKWRV